MSFPTSRRTVRGWPGLHSRVASIVALGLCLLTPGCAALREVAALHQVEFSIDRIGAVRLAGVDLTGIRSYEDLGVTNTARVAAAVLQNNVPLQFDLHLRAENPSTNTVNARLVGMDWTLLLQDKETIRGRLDRSIVLPPGDPQDIPLAMSLDLFDFFSSSARDLVDLALAVTGQKATRASVALRAVPSVETPFGPLRYPEPITIVRREFGPSSQD